MIWPKTFTGIALALLVVSSTIGAAASPAAAAPGGNIVECSVASGFFVDEPWGITAGPDGNIWFTNREAARIGRIDTSCASLTYFTLPPSPPFRETPTGITSGPDGALWFVADGASFTQASHVERSTIAGSITQYSVPGGLFGITTGPDGNLWFGQVVNQTVGVMSTAGALVQQYPLPGQQYPMGITAGPDGNVWVADIFGHVDRVTGSGVVTTFAPPTPNSDPQWITAGPDGNLWFTEVQGNNIARITPAGVITEFPIPTPFSFPGQITSGPDGNLWFAEDNGNNIARVTPSGVITEFPVPTANAHPFGITAGPDGNIWFTERFTAKVGRLTLGGGGATIGALQSMVTALNLPAGIANSLQSKLAAAAASVQRGSTASACGQLGAFNNKVNAQSGKSLTAAQAAQLSGLATTIRTNLRC